MKTRNKIFVFSITLAGMLMATGFWIFQTQSGANWIWSKVSNSVPGTLSTQELKGTLSSGFSFREITFRNSSLRVDVKTLRAQVKLNWFPVGIHIKNMDALETRIERLNDGDNSPDTDLAIELEGLSLPVPLRFDHIVLKGLQYIEPGQDQPIGLSRISASGFWHNHIEFDELDFALPGLKSRLQGKLSFSAPYDINVKSQSVFTPESDFPELSYDIQTHLSGDLSDLQIDSSANPGALVLNARVHHLFKAPSADITLTADRWQWPQQASDTQYSLRQLKSIISGSMDQYTVQLKTKLDTPFLSDISVDLQADGQENELNFQTIDIVSEVGRIEANGPINWREQIHASLNGRVEDLQMETWVNDWPTDQNVKGGFQLDWGGERFQLSRLDFSAGVNGPTVTGRGELDLEKDLVSADLRWQDFSWPIGATEPDIFSSEAVLQLRGIPEDWSLTGQLNLQAQQWPEAKLKVNGSGDLKSAQWEVENGEILGGRFAGQFSYSWTEQQAWSANVKAQNLDVTSLSPSYPGVINTDLIVNGQMKPLKLAVDIRSLEGRVRQQPLEAHGYISLEDDLVLAKDLQIRSGPNRIDLNGNIKDQNGLRFDAHIDSLQTFFPDAKGELTAKGLLSIHASKPLMELDLNGSSLVYADWRIDSISTYAEEQANESPVSVINMSGVTWGDQSLDELSFTLAGQKALNRVRIQARQNEAELDIHLLGSLSNWVHPLDANWNGRVESLLVQTTSNHRLQLEQATTISITRQQVQIEPMCLAGTLGGHICTEIEWQSEGIFAGNARLNSLPFAPLTSIFESDLTVTQIATGEMSWKLAPKTKPNIEVNLDISPGQISYLDDEEHLNTGPGWFNLQIVDGRLVAGNLDLTIDEVGQIDTDFSAPDITLGIDSPIKGHMLIEINRLKPIMVLVPQIDEAGGRIIAEIDLTGTLKQPDLSGHVSLSNGRISHLATGTIISDIALSGQVDKNEMIEITGQFKAGEGLGQINAKADFGNFLKPEVKLQLMGSDLMVINNPELNVTASPDLRLTWYDKVLNIDGKVSIPKAKVSPVVVPGSDAVESEDLQIVAGERKGQQDVSSKALKWSINGQLEVELGEKVSVELQRATAKLSGKTTFTWKNNLLPIADGRYQLEGKISAYGQVLDVSEGRINFPGVPADNPRLNISAEREIFGNLQVRTAGVSVTGTLQQPNLRAYTVPETTEERALTLLVTGHEFDYEQGVGGVELGLYIAPRLFVSYGFGLFDTQNVISARYDLKHGFGVKATSGQRETGVDISYTIER